jgi:hypothetical protein
MAVAAAAAAASNIERALIGSTFSSPFLDRHSGMRAEAEFFASRLKEQIGRNSYRG